MKLEDKIKQICLILFSLDIFALLVLCFCGFGLLDLVFEVLIIFGIIITLVHTLSAIMIKKILDHPTKGIESIYDRMIDTEWFFDDKKVYHGIQF